MVAVEGNIHSQTNMGVVVDMLRKVRGVDMEDVDHPMEDLLLVDRMIAVETHFFQA